MSEPIEPEPDRAETEVERQVDPRTVERETRREEYRLRSVEGEPIVTKARTYHVCRNFSRLWFLLSRRRYEGLHNLPAEGPGVLLVNHQSFFDIPLVASSTARHVCFMARDTLAETAWLADVMEQCGAILVRRGSADRAALKAMRAHLEAGDLVCVFPEGTRTRDGSVGEFRGGALVAARQAGAPLIPAGIRGNFEAWGRNQKLPLPRRVAIRYGAPLDPRAPDALEAAHKAVQEMVGDGRFRSVPPAP